MGGTRNGGRPILDVLVSASGRVVAMLSSSLVSFVGVLGAYLAVTSVAAFVPERGAARRSTPGRRRLEAPARRYRVLVPAHDERELIGSTVEGLLAVEADPDRYEVHVVADHCSDETAELARRAGASVREHDDPHPRGKGPALAWLVDELIDDGTLVDDDVIVVVDADTQVDPGFVRAIDRRFGCGSLVVQGNYRVLDPESSPGAALRFAALAARHHLRALGRTRLGSSCGLYGNGMAFDVATFRSVEMSGHLVEDLELSCEYALRGVAVDFAPDAIVAAEMPDTLAGSDSQHRRWEQGRIDVARRYVPRLARSVVRRSAVRRRARIDAVLDLLLPPMSVFVTAISSGALVSLVRSVRGSRRGRSDLVVCVFASASVAFHVVSAAHIADAPPSVYRSLTRAPTLVVWKTTMWLRSFVGRGDVGWIRTKRNAEDVAAGPGSGDVTAP